MGNSRRWLLAVLVGSGVLKVGSDYVSQQSGEVDENSRNQDEISEKQDGTPEIQGELPEEALDTIDVESIKETDTQQVLYHERQNVYLQSGQVFAETFRSSGQNTLRLKTPEFPTINGHLGLYTHNEWESLKQGVSENNNWEAGDSIRTILSNADKSVYEFELNHDTTYAIVFGLRDQGTVDVEPQNIGFEYWIYD